MVAEKKSENLVLSNFFEQWLDQCSESISVHPNGEFSYLRQNSLGNSQGSNLVSLRQLK